VLIPLPGHTPGSTGALVQLARRHRFLLAGRLRAACAVTLDRAVAPRNFVTSTAHGKSLGRKSARSRRRRNRACAATTPAQWDTLRKGADFYD
jgi:hypothetical protein